MAPDLIIVGEEAMTNEGELLCYYITSLVPDGLSLPEAIACVHEQGGICGPSHPLDPRRHGIGAENLLRYHSDFDFIETFNARVRDHTRNQEAEKIAGRLDVPGIACSDAHTLQEVGISRTRFAEDVNSAAEFLRALKTVERVPFYTSPITSASSMFASLVNKTGILGRAKNGGKPAETTKLR
jgi:predicted metal-dependent phosphoesterase TrpH